MAITIAAFGATGKTGKHFISQALDSGHALRVLVRDEAKLDPDHKRQMEVFVGDVTQADDVASVIEGVDVVVSCLGHVAHQPVMDTATQHILAAAKAQPVPPRCVLISSIGMGGTSWPIRMLLRAKLGKACLDDYQAADALVRTASDVRCVLVRPFALTDKPGKGVYAATESTSALFASSIARADVARFMLDAVTDRQWDGKPGIQLSGAPSPSPST